MQPLYHPVLYGLFYTGEKITRQIWKMFLLVSQFIVINWANV